MPSSSSLNANHVPNIHLDDDDEKHFEKNMKINKRKKKKKITRESQEVPNPIKFPVCTTNKKFSCLLVNIQMSKSAHADEKLSKCSN